MPIADNHYHVQVCRWLSELGIQYREEYPVGQYSIDIYIGELKRGVEVDGPSHGLRRKKDRQRDEEIFAAEGITMVRIPVGLDKEEALAIALGE